jgi:peroxiredoxin
MLPKGQQEAVFYLKQDGTTPKQSLRGEPSDPLFLAKIVVAVDPKRAPKIFSLPDTKRLAHCRPFDDIQDYELSPPPDRFKNGLFLNGVDLNKTYNINYRTFHNQPEVPIAFGSAQEWTIKAASPIDDDHYYANNHPFHLHVNPFQVVMKTDANGRSRPMNVWRDTLLIKGGESYTIRTRFRDFKGKTVLHCHILDHEDQGMMVPLNISEPAGSKGASGAHLKPLSAPAPPLELPEVGAQSCDLARFRGRSVILVFFQGADCSHCAQQLHDLVREARQAGRPETEIVAVSSREVADPDRALRILGVTGSDRFHLLVDEGHRAFRAFDCFDGGPLHGLFLIDPKGTLRAGYTGASPYGDTREVVRLARALPSSTTRQRE